MKQQGYLSRLESIPGIQILLRFLLLFCPAVAAGIFSNFLLLQRSWRCLFVRGDSRYIGGIFPVRYLSKTMPDGWAIRGRPGLAVALHV